MTGITLSPEQLREAPPEVRRWIEREVMKAFSPPQQQRAAQRQIPPLAICSQAELTAVLSMIQGVFPAVNVFFELGRKGASFAEDRLEAYRVSEIQHHTRLQSPQQVISCLDLINASLHRIRGSSEVSFYGADGDYCFVATETQQNIRRLWMELIAHGDAAAGAQAEPASSSDDTAHQGPMPPGDRATASGNSGWSSRP